MPPRRVAPCQLRVEVLEAVVGETRLLQADSEAVLHGLLFRQPFPLGVARVRDNLLKPFLQIFEDARLLAALPPLPNERAHTLRPLRPRH